MATSKASFSLWMSRLSLSGNGEEMGLHARRLSHRRSRAPSVSGDIAGPVDLSDIRPLNPNSNILSISLQICASCQGSLMQVFSHCLSRQKGVFPSTRELLGEAEASQKKERTALVVPNLNHTLNLKAEEKLFVTDTEKHEHSKLFENEMKQLLDVGKKMKPVSKSNSHSRPTSPQPSFLLTPAIHEQEIQHVEGKLQQNISDAPKAARLEHAETHSDDDSDEDEVKLKRRVQHGSDSRKNMMLKQHMIAQKNEILRLKAALAATKETEKNEYNLIQKLQHALQKSLDYCNRANEWQEQESRVMKTVMDELKGQVSALMAYLILVEQDKQTVRQTMAEVNQSKQQAEQNVRDLERSIEELKAKLHHAYKDYLAISEKCDRMVREAAHGTEVAHQRNMLLKNNLESLSKEYAQLNQQKLEADSKIRNMEFELNEMVNQFNQLGEAKIQSDMEKKRLVDELDRWKGDYQYLNDEHNSLQDRHLKLDDEYRESTRKFEDQLYNLGKKHEELTKDFQELTAKKKEDDKELARLHQESTENTATIKEHTAVKLSMEERFKRTETSLKKDNQAKDQQIKELTTQLTNERQKAQKLAEQKEQLLFEVTDLKNSLEREQQNLNNFKENAADEKSKLTDTIHILEDRITKLETYKTNLLQEKKVLADSLKHVKTQLKQTEDDFATFRQVSDEKYAILEESKKKYQDGLTAEKDAHRQLRHQHADLQKRYNQALTDLGMNMSKCKEMGLNIQELTARVNDLEKQLEVMTTKFKSMEQHRNELSATNNKLVDELDASQKQIYELEHKLIDQRDNLNDVVKGRDEVIVNLRATIVELKDDMLQQSRTRRHLMTRLEQLIAEYRRLKEVHEEECQRRIKIERTLTHLREDYELFMKDNRELNDLKLKFDRQKADTLRDASSMFQQYNRTSKSMDERLRAEFEHLNMLFRNINQIVGDSGPSFLSKLQDNLVIARPQTNTK